MKILLICSLCLFAMFSSQTAYAATKGDADTAWTAATSAKTGANQSKTSAANTISSGTTLLASCNAAIQTLAMTDPCTAATYQQQADAIEFGINASFDDYVDGLTLMDEAADEESIAIAAYNVDDWDTAEEYFWYAAQTYNAAKTAFDTVVDNTWGGSLLLLATNLGV